MSRSAKIDPNEVAPIPARIENSSPIVTLSDLLRDLDPASCLPFENRLLTSICESTNDLGKRLGGNGPIDHGDGTRPIRLPWLIIALEQSRGKGRLGKTWSSPAGGIYVSIVLPDYPTVDLYSLPTLTGVGLCKGLGTLLPKPCKLKWPNDLLIRGRKIGGILIETASRSATSCHAVIGFGVNYRTAPEDSTYPATSIVSESFDPPSLPEAIRALILAVSDELQRSSEPGYAAEAVNRYSAHRIGDEMTCRTSDGTVSGRFLGFDSRGFLRLKAGGSEQILTGAEVVFSQSETPE